MNRVNGQEPVEIERYPDGNIPAPGKYVDHDGQVIVRTRFSTHQMFTKPGNAMYGDDLAPAILGSHYCQAEGDEDRVAAPRNDHLMATQFSVYYPSDGEAVLYEVVDP